MAGIGSLRETSLHASLKTWWAHPGDVLEASVDGYVVDLLRGKAVVEIQTGHFSAIRPKLRALLARRPVCLVYPIALQRWIVRLDTDRQTRLSRRKSPRRGSAAQVFAELVSFPEFICDPNFTLVALLVHDEEVRCPWPRARGGWRRRSRVLDRRLIEVVEGVRLTGPADCLALLPTGLSRPFTNRELSSTLRQPAALAAKMTYCLRQMGALSIVGKRGRAALHDLAPEMSL